MSISLLELIDIMRHLSFIHYEILLIMEKSLRRFEYVPLQYIAKKVRIKPNKLEEIMDFLLKYKLVKKKQEEYIGYALTYKGLDAIALRSLSMYGVITKVGPKIGVGKEGDIWITYFDNEPRILKLYRISKECFRRIRVYRYYYMPNKVYSWYQLAFRSAQREFRALTVLYNAGVHVPKPIARSRHAIVMDYIDGVELVKARLPNPLDTFSKIIREIVKAYKVGIVHADLSEFNVLVTRGGEVYLIDFPQYIVSSKPEAIKYLTEDLARIVNYFRKKYRIDPNDLKRIINEILKEEGVKI